MSRIICVFVKLSEVKIFLIYDLLDILSWPNLQAKVNIFDFGIILDKENNIFFIAAYKWPIY